MIDRPVIIIGCNRSGTTLLFRNLGEHPLLWSFYEESPHAYRPFYPIHPELGDRVAAGPDPAVASAIRARLFADAHNREVLRDHRRLGWLPPKLFQRPLNRFYKRAPLRLLEKTPANALRVPLLHALFPDARFVFLVRRAEDVISSLMEGWKNWSRTGSGPWVYSQWHYLAPPGWQTMTGRPLAEICAFQWREATRTAWEDLERLCPGRYLLIRHEDALVDPRPVYARVLEFAELPPSAHLSRVLEAGNGRWFTHGGSAPRAGKWKQLHGEDVERVRPMFRDLQAQLYPEAS